MCYEFYIMINGEWTLAQGYSRKNYYTFVPFKNGSYRVLVLDKSFHKDVAYEDYDIVEFKLNNSKKCMNLRGTSNIWISRRLYF